MRMLFVLGSDVMVISHLFQQQQLFMEQLEVTVIFNGDPNRFCATEQTINNLMAVFVVLFS